VVRRVVILREAGSSLPSVSQYEARWCVLRTLGCPGLPLRQTTRLSCEEEAPPFLECSVLVEIAGAPQFQFSPQQPQMMKLKMDHETETRTIHLTS
jgi:hypothetical protein